ncbi:ABC transporter permease [Bdellovibrio svalbardensis]|uniref:ABC transporter permease n=1 Tax=Bdellovibrio svalbardensis TaxID=2972972 RepID=A0ABT6DHZ4_9BACT|nr:ABC transporter permease [Bdellovibrio svalbardensis]MDG0816411.1 ABC transporter permease [Bdellovibrio svalbardensis]
MNSANSLYAQDFGNLQIAMAFVLVLVAMAISKLLKLDLKKDFFIASLRTTLQLIGVGYILRWVFKSESLVVNLLILLVMTLVAAQAVTSRLKQKNLKYYVAALVALLASVWPLGFIALEVFFRAQALQQSIFFIPFMGVLMGNALSAISLAFVGLERVRAENILEIETFKALGANSFEACQRLYRDLLRNALTPNLNGMTIVGIVSLPGVMAGQLIGGVDPVTAARFQILVMFLILLTAMVGTLVALGLNHFFFMPSWLTSQEQPWSFPLEQHEKLVLSGPSGTGKSRLLKSMRLLDLESVRATLQNKSSVKLLESSSLKTQYLHQRAFFIPGTVEENLRWPFSFKNNSEKIYKADRIQKFLKKLGLPPDILQKNATTLSGGEGQLIHLIRSLQFDPQVLFLDEPSSSLDSQKTELLEAFLDEWTQQKNHSLVMITHNRDQTKRFASKVLLLKDEGLMYE